MRLRMVHWHRLHEAGHRAAGVCPGAQRASHTQNALCRLLLGPAASDGGPRGLRPRPRRETTRSKPTQHTPVPEMGRRLGFFTLTRVLRLVGVAGLRGHCQEADHARAAVSSCPKWPMIAASAAVGVPHGDK